MSLFNFEQLLYQYEPLLYRSGRSSSTKPVGVRIGTDGEIPPR
jgi:hypothetical protein